jgi:hypothetical protein
LGDREHQKIYWILNSTKKDFVPKDPNWLSDHLPQLQAFWDEVVQHRANGTRPETKQIVSLDV